MLSFCKCFSLEGNYGHSYSRHVACCGSNEPSAEKNVILQVTPQMLTSLVKVAALSREKTYTLQRYKADDTKVGEEAKKFPARGQQKATSIQSTQPSICLSVCLYVCM
jgi:hypothetical protein